MGEMGSIARGGLGLLKDTYNDFSEDQSTRMAAALSYYTVFSLPPLLMLLLLVAGAVLDPREVERAIETQIGGLVGTVGAEQIRVIIQHAKHPGAGGPLTTVISVVTLLFGATGAFIELQADLNRAWEVRPDPKKGGIKNFLLRRLFSLGMVLAIAFLLLVSLAVSAALVAFGGVAERLLPGVSEAVLQVGNAIGSFIVITLLFAAMFKVLPDAVIAWRDAIFGGAATTFLFVIGKYLIGLYLGKSNPGSAYGAAGSLAIVFVWVYYSSIILFFGAELTQAWAKRRGRELVPKDGAERVVEEVRRGEESGERETR
jgi:membrane protein